MEVTGSESISCLPIIIVIIIIIIIIIVIITIIIIIIVIVIIAEQSWFLYSGAGYMLQIPHNISITILKIRRERI